MTENVSEAAGFKEGFEHFLKASKHGKNLAWCSEAEPIYHSTRTG